MDPPKERRPLGSAIGRASTGISNAFKTAPGLIFDRIKSSNNKAGEVRAADGADFELLENGDDVDSETSTKEGDRASNRLERFMDDQPKTVVDGLLRGLASVGHGVVDGVSGIVLEPVRAARAGGASGFARGVGKGLAGVVVKPMAGVVSFVGKTAEGIVNTPGTLITAVRRPRRKNGSGEGQGQGQGQDDDVGNVYCVPLEESLYLYGPNHIVYVASKYLHEHVEEEGLFRLSGSKSHIEALKKRIDICGPESAPVLSLPDVPLGEAIGCHEVASVLKAYFRSLPEPLLTFERFQPFMDALKECTTDIEEKNIAFKTLVDTLPAPNKQVLHVLLQLLHAVHMKASVNRMTSLNLGVVFGPILLGDAQTWTYDNSSASSSTTRKTADAHTDPQALQSLLMALEPMKEIVSYLILGYPFIFPNFTAEAMDT
eukprot:TRINITY_DN10696_c0_g1_i3.p1 TRINITY_DN10696_c0_g1~~TRINITY_DN10696_c0_g1_i3.p1  ORF type:complete len:430 (-),score=78.54 TRINITY_DN10696_c0_g1_i3:38-1327(-)